MSIRKNKFISVFLSFVMVLTLVLQVLPPIKVHAADGGEGGLEITAPSDGDTINGFDTVKIKWNKYSGVDHYILVIKDNTTGEKIFEEELGSSTKVYNVYYDDYIFTEDGHEYKIYIAAQDESNKVMNGAAAWHAIYVENKLKLGKPDIISHGNNDTHCIDNALYVEWDPVDGADGYKVNVKKLNGSPDFGSTNESGTAITYTWSDDCEIKVDKSKLVENTWYKIAVCATNSDKNIDSDWTVCYISMLSSSYLNVSEYPDELAAEKNSTASFWIESNLEWEISCNVSWVSWSVDQADDTRTRIIVKATSENTGTSSRKAKFTISADGVDDEYVYVTQLAHETTEDLAIKSIEASTYSVNTLTEVDFTVTASSATKYGVDIYAGDYFLQRVTSYSQSGDNFIYTYKGHRFTSEGTKTIYAYPVTSSDDTDKTVSASCEITVNAPYGIIENPEIRTTNNQTISGDEAFSVTWNKPSAPSSGITYSVYIMKSGTSDNKLVKGDITNKKCSIPASFFDSDGRYVITVYALAPGYSQNATGSILVVNVKSDDSIYVESVTPSETEIETLTDIDFTIKASTSAKYGVAVYAGTYYLTTIEDIKTSNSTYTKYVYNDYNFMSAGTKNIYIYPLDSNKNIIRDEGAYATCSVKVTADGVCGTPTITTAANQTIKLNSDFDVAWKKPSVPSSGVKYNVYVRHSYDEDGVPLDNSDKVVNTSMLTSKSLTIDGSFFTEKDTYTITVYAMASGYVQSDPAVLLVYVSDGYRLQVNAKKLTAYEGGGKGNDITVTANTSWTVSSDVDWITLSISSGSGNGQFYPTIAANDSAEERSGNIIVSGGGITREISVIQGGVLINSSAKEESVYDQPVSTVRVEVYAQESAESGMCVLTEGFSVSYGRYKTKTDANGIATIPYDADSGYDLIVSKEGYSSQTIKAQQLDGSSAVLVAIYLAPADSKPVINAVWVLDTNILKDSYSVDLLSKYSTSFLADVDWGSDSYGSISLWQNGKQVKFTEDKLQTVLSEKFDVSDSIYIVAINSSGKETRAKLKLESGGGYPEWLDGIELKFTDKFSFELPESILLLGGRKYTIDLEEIKSLPINFCVDGNKVYVSIGLDIWEYKKKSSEVKGNVKFIKELFAEAKKGMTTDIKYDWNKFFKSLKSKYNDQIKYPKGKFLVEGDIKAVGFIEAYMDSYGKLVILDAGLIINPEGAVKLSGNFTVPIAPMIPLVWEAKLKVELEARLNIITNEAAKGFIPYGDFDGEISLSGGLGVGIAKAASVTGGIKGALEPTWEIHRDLSSHFKFDASFGVYAKISCALFEIPWNHELARTTLYENPSAAKNSRMYSMYSNDIALLGDYTNTDDYELQDREYLNYDSGFTMNENETAVSYTSARALSARSDISTDKATVFYENIYPNSDPVIGTFDDGTMIAVYIGDDTTRTDINRTRLYYSFYNGIEWSQPAPVDAIGQTADFSPALVIAQNKAFITWQDATKTFSDSDTLETIAPYFDISIAVFDPTNKNIVTHTIENTGLDMAPIICADEDNVSIVWINNALNDWFGCNNENSILAYTYKNNSWGNVVSLKSSLTSLRSLDAQYVDSTLNTVYSVDTDNDVETVTDIATYLMVNGNDTVITSDSGIVNSAIIRNGTIYWQENGNIMYCDVDDLNTVNSIFTSDANYSINSYDLLDNGYDKYAIFVIGDGLYSKLGISIFDNSSMTWSDIIYISDGSNMISDYDAIITSDGFIRVIATQTAVTGDITSDDPYGLSDIIICDVYINGDLTVESVEFDMSKTVGDTTAEIYAYVVNNGKETIESSVISIYDQDWNLISTSIDKTVIKPGAEAILIAYMDIDDAIIGSDVTVVVKPRGINDVNLEDNSVEITVNYFDIALEQMTYGINSNGDAVIYANVVNRGYRTEKNITAYLRKGSADATVIKSTEISSIDMFDSIPVQFTVTYEEGAVYYITVNENDGDMMISNNQDFVVLVGDTEGFTVTGKITGYNPNNAATVKLIQNGTVVKTIEVTSPDGEATQEFVIENVSNGTYDLVVTKTSHLRYTIKNVKINGENIDLRDTYPIVMVAGDINGDGIVGVADLGIVQNNYGKDPASSTDSNVRNSDITGDGIIGITDIAIVQEKSNYGKQNADDPYYDNCTYYYN